MISLPSLQAMDSVSGPRIWLAVEAAYMRCMGVTWSCFNDCSAWIHHEVNPRFRPQQPIGTGVIGNDQSLVWTEEAITAHRDCLRRKGLPCCAMRNCPSRIEEIGIHKTTEQEASVKRRCEERFGELSKGPLCRQCNAVSAGALGKRCH